MREARLGPRACWGSAYSERMSRRWGAWGTGRSIALSLPALMLSIAIGCSGDKGGHVVVQESPDATIAPQETHPLAVGEARPIDPARDEAASAATRLSPPLRDMPSVAVERTTHPVLLNPIAEQRPPKVRTCFARSPPQRRWRRCRRRS